MSDGIRTITTTYKIIDNKLKETVFTFPAKKEDEARETFKQYFLGTPHFSFVQSVSVTNVIELDITDELRK